MAPSESESKPGFSVTDRRSFAADGEAKAEPAAKGQGADAAESPPVDFHTFVLSLGTSALMHLGEIEHPDTGKPEKNLPLAKQAIDVLAMLRDKTKGNVTPPEETLLDNLLYDLRMRFVDASKA